MILYDIHTHKREFEKGTSDYQIRSLVSVSPDLYLTKGEDFSGSSYFSCGIHPWKAVEGAGELVVLADILGDDRVVAVGEVGLDKLRGATLAEQVEVFREQIKLAILFDKPLIIHCVKAWDELIGLYKEFKCDIPWILHGYRGGVEQTKQLVKFGFKFSIGEKFNAESLSFVPLNSIFCETDDSDISISKVYADISVCLKLSFEQFAGKVAENTRIYFKNMTK